MRPQKVSSYIQRLDHLFKQVDHAAVGDIELQAHWAKYLCVLVSGLIEVGVREMYGQFAKDRSAPEVANFVARALGQFQNAKMNKILDLVGGFDPEWEEDLRTKTEGEVKDAVDSIVANRHIIAHGGQVGITIASMTRYYEAVKTLISIMEEQCDARAGRI